VTRVFLDANVYFAGVVSEDGASAFILHLAKRKKIVIFASKLVLREADRNLRKKTSSPIAKSFRRFLRDTKIKVAPAPGEETLQEYESFIHPKDVPVLAFAIESKVDFFITLDKKHFFVPAIISKVKKIRIITPGDFIRDFYLKGKV